jgi:hypothetical protein
VSVNSPRVRLAWLLEEGVLIEGVKGVDAEWVEVDHLVRWARKRRRGLRRDMKRGALRRELRDAEWTGCPGDGGGYREDLGPQFGSQWNWYACKTCHGEHSSPIVREEGRRLREMRARQAKRRAWFRRLLRRATA